MSDLVKRVSPNYIQELAKSDYKDEYKYLSPVNLKLQSMTKIELPELKWLHMDSEPNKIKIANTGQTVIVSGTWQKNRPRISGGPLLTTYTFSQLHYHWGSDNTYGSEHSYNDKKVPLEMHAVFLKESCKKQEDALAEKDGAVVVSYAYKLDDEPNPGIELVCEELPYIPNPSQLIELEDPVYLSTFINPFQNDYFIYWGSVRTNACKHVLLWILCRQPYSINEKQLEIFRQLFTSGHQPIMHNSRYTHFQGYEVFHVNPSAYNEDVLYKQTENNKCKVALTKRRIKELKSRRKNTGRYLRINRCKHGSSSSADVSSNSAVRIISSKTKTNRSNSPFEDHLDEAKNKHAVTTHYNGGAVKKGSSTSNTNDRTKQKRQSYYTKFFSLQDKINKEQNNNKPFSQIKNNKNVTVMNLVVGNSSDIEFYSEENQIAQDTGENYIFKQIKTQIEDQKTKNENEIVDINALKYINTHRNEEEMFGFTREGFHTIDTNLLEKIKFSQSTNNIHENWDDYETLKFDTSKTVTFNKNFNINAEEYESEVHCYRVSSELQTCYPFQSENNFNETVISHSHIENNETKNEIYKDCSDQMAHELNSNESNSNINKVQDVGINTISLNELILSMSVNKGSNVSVTFSKNECIDEKSNLETVTCSSKIDYNDNVNDEELTLAQSKSKQKSHYTSSNISQSSSKKKINSEKPVKTNSQSKFLYSDKNSSPGSSTELSENEQSDTSEDNKIKIGRLSRISIKHSPYSNAERLNQRKKYQPKYKKHFSRASNTKIKSNINGKNQHKSKEDSETSVSSNKSVKFSSNKITKPEIQQTTPKKTSITNISLNESKKSKSSHSCATESEKEFLKAKELHMHISATTLGEKNKFKIDSTELCRRTESGTSQPLIQSNSYLSQKNSGTKKYTATSFKQTPHICYDLNKKKEEILLASNKSLSNYQASNNTSLITPISSLKNTASNTNHASNEEIPGLKAKFSIHQGNLQLLEETITTKIPSLKTAATLKRQNYLNNAKAKIRPQTVVTSTRRFVTNNLNRLRPKTTPSCTSNAVSAITTGSKGNLTGNSTLTTNNNTGGKTNKVNNSSKVPVKSKPVSPARAWRY